jgi:hypothetical protein
MTGAVQVLTPPETRAWLVRKDERDAVIVSGEAGIYLYEPGTVPVKLDAVEMEGCATEAEDAQVITTASGVEAEYAGDELVTMASRDAAEELAVEQRDAAEEAAEGARKRLESLLDKIRAAHDTEPSGHAGLFQWCTHPVCGAVRALAN